MFTPVIRSMPVGLLMSCRVCNYLPLIVALAAFADILHPSRFSFNIAHSDMSPLFDGMLPSAPAYTRPPSTWPLVSERGPLMPHWPAFTVACPQITRLQRESVLLQLHDASQGNSRAGVGSFHHSAVAITLAGWRFLPGQPSDPHAAA